MNERTIVTLALLAFGALGIGSAVCPVINLVMTIIVGFALLAPGVFIVKLVAFLITMNRPVRTRKSSELVRTP